MTKLIKQYNNQDQQKSQKSRSMGDLFKDQIFETRNTVSNIVRSTRNETSQIKDTSFEPLKLYDSVIWSSRITVCQYD